MMRIFKYFMFPIAIGIYVSVSISSCNVQNKVTNGKEAYELKQYAVALKMLTKEFESANNPESKSYIAYLAGQSALKTHDVAKAIDWLEKSNKLSEQEQVLFALASAYKQNEDYNKSLAFFGELARKYNSPIYKDEYRSLKTIIDFKLYEPDTTFKIKTLKSNSKYNDYSPVLIDSKLILFSSDRPKEPDNEEYSWTGNYFSDLYVMGVDGSGVSAYDDLLNTKEHEGSACLSSDQKEIYYTRCENIELRDKHCRIYTSRKIGGRWTDPIAISFFDEKVNVGHPALMANDSLLLFSVAPHGNYDSYDLYYSRRLPTGWTKASYLEGNINSAGHEKFPVAEVDTLYFSSDKSKGLGGLDIYKTYIMDNGAFSNPEALKAPINSGYDDFGYIRVPSQSKRNDIEYSGMFTSSRGNGSDDQIYYFDKFKPVQEQPSELEDDNKEEEELIIYIAGKVVDNTTGLAVSDVLMEVNGTDTNIKKRERKGQIIFDGKEKGSYNISASKSGYFKNDIDVKVTPKDLKGKKGSVTINVTIGLEPIVVDKEIVIENIFYDFDKWDIRNDAKPALDSLVKTLLQNQNVKIELASHTDCQGDDDYNLELSQKRAKSAIEYIASKGVARSNLSYKGYGESKLQNDCNCDDCSDEEHQINRRTTFKVLSF